MPSGAGQAKVVERIIAVVNREIVLLSELDERAQSILPQLERVQDPAERKKKLEQLKRQFLDHMIDEKLVLQEAQALKLEVTDRELDSAVEDVMKKNGLTKVQLEEALKREGKTLLAYRETMLRPQLTRLRVINIRVRSRVSVGDDELKAKYQQNLRELGVQTKIRARHIFIKVPVDADRKQLAERKRYTASLLKEIKAGKDFGEMARKHSEDSVTRNDGGDLGYFSRGTLPSNVEAVVFEMKQGEIRGPLRAARGFHLIQLVDRKDSSARPLKDVKEELYNQLYTDKMEKATRSWLKEIRRRAHIDVRL
jgi:peptidyl-prolyl cis-trans isomerase SurA